MNGVIVLDKPAGFTSFDVVAVLRGLAHEKKVGHTGTLDPMATGVLPLLFGRATRAASLLPDTDKEYEAGFRFGLATDTQDSTGSVVARSEVSVTREMLESALPLFRGEILQTPPMVSAVSVGGHRLYDLARKGIVVEREKRPVTIQKLELLKYDEASRTGKLRIACTKGTYIRTLCADLGEALGSCGVMVSLRRTRAAGFSLADSVSLDEAKELAAEGKLVECVVSTESLFSCRPAVHVTEKQSVRFSNGGALDLGRTELASRDPGENSDYRVYAPDGKFLGLGRVSAGELHVLRLF